MLAKRFYLLAFALLFGLLAEPTPTHAQFAGYFSPQTVARRVFNATTLPVASDPVPNLGQGQHFLTYTTTGSVQAVRIQLEGSNDGVYWIRISETATGLENGGVQATTYMSFIRANLVQFDHGVGATLTAYYSGTSVGAGYPIGAFSNARVEILATVAPANVSHTYYLPVPPTGGEGNLIFQFSDATCAASTITVDAGSDGNHLARIMDSALPITTLAASNQIQAIPTPSYSGSLLAVTYTTTCISAATYYLAYSLGAHQVKCTQRATIALSAVGRTQIMAPAVAGQSLYICHISISFAAGDDVTFVEGTGVACGTGTASFSGVYKNVLTMDLDFRDGLPIKRNNNFCINLASGSTGGGMVLYGQY